jgi:hypothetical protein
MKGTGLQRRGRKLSGRQPQRFHTTKTQSGHINGRTAQRAHGGQERFAADAIMKVAITVMGFFRAIQDSLFPPKNLTLNRTT